MATKPAPELKEFPADSLEKKIYTLVDSLKEFIPIDNDRYRLSFGLYKYLSGDGDAPEILVNSTKINFVGIDKAEMVQKLNDGITGLK